MENIIADQVKVGILSDIRKRHIKEKYKNGMRIALTFSIGKDLRGIVFVKNQNIGQDILYPNLEYPILPSGPIYYPIIGITKYEDLGPLLRCYNLNNFNSEDFQKFADEVLLNKKWIKENQELFGFLKKKFGPIQLTYTYNQFMSNQAFPEKLGKLIYDINEKPGFSLSKKEQKNYWSR